jgi:hypothetical protein
MDNGRDGVDGYGRWCRYCPPHPTQEVHDVVGTVHEHAAEVEIVQASDEAQELIRVRVGMEAVTCILIVVIGLAILIFVLVIIPDKESTKE